MSSKRFLQDHASDPVYASVLAIDPDSLDEEWLYHPALFMEACDALTEVEKALARVELNLDRRRSAIDLDVRIMPESYGLNKATNDAAANIAAQDEEVIALEDQKLALQTEASRRKYVVRAMEHRKSALEELSHLFRAQYYSEPRTAKGGSSEDVASWRERQKEAVVRRHKDDHPRNQGDSQ